MTIEKQWNLVSNNVTAEKLSKNVAGDWIVREARGSGAVRGANELNIFGTNQNIVVGIFLLILVTSLGGFVTFLFHAQYDADLQAFATILAALLAASVVGWQIHSAAHLQRLSHQRQTITDVYGELSKCIVEAQSALIALPHKCNLVVDIATLQIPDAKIKLEATENAIKEFAEQYDIQDRKISEFVDILRCWQPIIPNQHLIVAELHPVRTSMVTVYPKVMQGLQTVKLQIYSTVMEHGQIEPEPSLIKEAKILESISKDLFDRLTAAHIELRTLINK